MSNYTRRIKIKQGLRSALNSLSTLSTAVEGEPHFCTDTNQMYIFDGSGMNGVSLNTAIVNSGEVITNNGEIIYN
jgi:hypothetical protein